MGEPAAATELVVVAPAKLNLYMRVLGRRPDGYHDIDTLALPLSLADEVVVGRSAMGRYPRVVSMRYSWPRELGPRPGMKEELAGRAAAAMAAAHAARPSTAVRLIKRIPIAAGLGGGSADAAAVLHGLNELWGRPLDDRRLIELAIGLGSDVPALLAGGPVRVGGRGEVVEPVRVAELWWVLLPLGFGVRSADAYGWWDEDGGVTGPDPEPVVEAAVAGQVSQVAGLVFNDLEDPVTRRHPEVGEAKERLLQAGALGALMSGSGPTVAGLAQGGEHAEEIASRIDGSAIVVRGPG
jgi:4-diphosphocytidyl-2-C-methyl-D-erythritol kinase